MSEPLRFNNVIKRFGKQAAIDAVSMQIEAGEFVALLGPSGCGKTTLLRCLAGLETADAGEIEIGDRTVFSSIKNINRPAQDRGIGFVFQDLGLWPHMTVAEHLMFVLADLFDNSECQKRTKSQLADLKIDHLAQKKPSQLSGGESQRLALARALVTQPRVLLLDEPLASLDNAVASEIRRLLEDIKDASGTTMVYVTHSREEAMELGDRIAIMKDGQISQIDTPEALYNEPGNEFAATFLGDCNIVPGDVVQATSMFSTALGDFPIEKSMSSPRLVLRAHQIVENDDGREAKILKCAFRGGYYTWTIAISDEKFFMNGTRPGEVGETVKVKGQGNLWFVEGANS